MSSQFSWQRIIHAGNHATNIKITGLCCEAANRLQLVDLSGFKLVFDNGNKKKKKKRLLP